mmetsp:Transcript_21620/g.73508  ORF Transcript_21620/g.73508 Transcript_21620/m.73508 type:complete len:532 (+) Transcript_21620:345-1940(+)
MSAETLSAPPELAAASSSGYAGRRSEDTGSAGRPSVDGGATPDRGASPLSTPPRTPERGRAPLEREDSGVPGASRSGGKCMAGAGARVRGKMVEGTKGVVKAGARRAHSAAQRAWAYSGEKGKQLRKGRAAVIKKIRRSKPRDEREAEALERLKAVAADKGWLPLSPRMLICGDEDATLLRFLRARKLDLGKAAKMLGDTIEWRRANGVDDILLCPLHEETLEAYRKMHSNSYIGFDRHGRPVYLELTGEMEVEGLLDLGVDFLVKHHVFGNEYMTNVMFREASEAKGEMVEHVVCILDLTGLTLARARRLMKVFPPISAVDANNYPETMGALICVNAPWYASTIWKMVAPFIDKNTQAKIKITSTLEAARKAFEQVGVDITSVPVACGGVCTRPMVCTPDGGLTDSLRRMDEHARENARRVAAGEETLLDICDETDRERLDEDTKVWLPPEMSVEELDFEMDEEVSEALEVASRAIHRANLIKEKKEAAEQQRRLGLSADSAGPTGAALATAGGEPAPRGGCGCRGCAVM